ncbi:unnamed protein product [Rotaria sordida]|uniref:Uncharacterized protein n=1 Tax=Rotaria sordida TaxID=392033 RepID=A0A814KS09_9BILA|nr:unnamed protein product [Rotaria sordida]CAF1228213.1 unnamed protein product [Rotaria sordida]CAF1234023.1 unnamed protein product [Rotaria sordida]
MQPINILLMFIFGYLTLLAMTCALSEQQYHIVNMRMKRALANKRFYDFGSRSININDDSTRDSNDEFDRIQRFYDFGTRKRFYDFGSKKRSNE